MIVSTKTESKYGKKIYFPKIDVENSLCKAEK